MPKIGLEIHGYLDTREKLFCSCNSIHGLKKGKPNTNICPICTGQPGAKPELPNSSAVKKAIQIGLILGCKINQKLPWQRKHYSWPDLPKGYQNTLSGDYATPIGSKGKFMGIRITECHLEEDPAAWNPDTGEIDYNRSGSPLIEIVTEPDFKTSLEVTSWLKNLIAALSYIKALDKTSGIKADVNISLPESNGKRVEIKNVNSISNIKKAIDFETERQKKETPKSQETRRYDEKENTTSRMRSKEEAQDYRFISDPDLPTLKIETKKILKLKSELPETPQEKLKKLIKKHRIPEKPAKTLTRNIDVAEFFEIVIEKISPNLAIPWITGELLSVLNYNKKSLGDPEIDIRPEHFIELLQLLEEKTITELKAQEILRGFIPKSSSPKKLAKSQATISSNKDIRRFVDKIVKENPKAVQDYKSGKKESLNFLVGQVMKISNKRADFKIVRNIFEKKLN